MKNLFNNLYSTEHTQTIVKKKRAAVSTIRVPPVAKNNSHSVMKLDQSNISPVQKAEGSTSNVSVGFQWTELDIPFECPASDCSDIVPPDLPSTVNNLFCQWSKDRYDYGHDAPEVLNLETRICIELGVVRILGRARRFAKSMGFDKVNLEALPDRILGREKDILTLVSDKAYRDSCYSWEALLDELKTGNSSLEALEKGKSIPFAIIEQVRPG
jgi:hypothetical protein